MSRRVSGAALSLLAWAAWCGLARGEKGDFISGDEYHVALIDAVDRATSTVTAYVYLYSLNQENPDAPAARLASSLGAAARRGVRVDVVFNGRSGPSGDEDYGTLDDKNRAAAEALHRGGVRVFFETAPSLLHAKVVVIDGARVLLGSSNWSHKSFTENIEANLAVRDPSLARRIESHLAVVPREPFRSEDDDSVHVPVTFLHESRGLRLFSRRRAESALDVYLWLLKETQSPGASSTVRVNLEGLAAQMGKGSLPRNQQRFFASRNLRDLRDLYGVADVVFHDDADAEVTPRSVTGDVFSIPRDYWSFGWDRRLQFSGKAFFLLSRYYGERSPSRPRWRRSKLTMERDHGVSESTLDRGTVELKRADLLEVRHSPIPPSGEPRSPNDYTPNPFYDPRVRDEERRRLADRAGAEKFERAARIAVQFYEDSDLEAIQALIDLEDRFGRDKVDRAVRRIGAKSLSNPKRNIGYLITTIRNPERPDQTPAR
jgi:hypothetical protein